MAESVVRADDEVESLQKAFRQYEGALAVDNARRASTLAAVFMLGGWLMDQVVFPDLVWVFLLNRAICVILLGVVFLLLGRVSSLKVSSRIGWAIPILPMASICVMIAQTGGGNSSYYGGLNTVLVGLSLLLRWSFMDSLLMVGTCFLAYSVSVVVAPAKLDLQTFANNCFFLMVTSVFVVAGSFYYERLRFREFSLRDQVEKSKGQLESQNRQLSELDEAKTRFFANISHELRTPLTIMLGITERLKSVLQKEVATPQVDEMISMLGQSGLRLLKLIDDLLDLVRFDTGHADVRRQPTLISAHLEGILRSLRHLAEQDRVALLWTCEADSESIQLDRDKFDKILLNLVINAIKFTPSGGVIEVKVRVFEGSLMLTVEDSGVGIPPEVLPRIFERFWQVDTSSTRKFQGAGIGLALVRSLTEAMDGDVKVESKVGHGTTFTVKLPVEGVEEHGVTLEDSVESGGQIADMHRRAAMSFQGKGNPRAVQTGIGVGVGGLPSPLIGGRPSGAKPLVLIADDEPDIRRFLRMQLEDADVIEASDGVEAMELVRERRPQLALLDHMMPEMDGVEVCRRIRENHTTRGVAVIILTARADEQTKLDALQAGANDFLTKPFSTAELGLRLQNQLAMARIRREMVDLNQELQSALEQIKESEVLMVRNEKLSSLGRMSAGIIHEINNPLNYSRAGLHILETYTRHLPEGERPDYEDTVKDIREGVERVAQIVIDLRQFTRDDNGIAGDADLCEVIGRAKRMVGHQVGKEIAFDAEMPGQAVIRGNPNQLVQVFINLFQNSIDAIHQRIAELGGDPGRIRVAIEPAGEGWTVAVRDNGIGIPPENLQNIFDPFFTSKDVGKGMGLGLSITHQILQNHSAKVDVESRPGQFTSFQLTFPGPNQAREMESVLDHFESRHHSPSNQHHDPTD